MSVIRRYTFKLYPSSAQAVAMDRMRQMHCALYNAALQERCDQWRREVERAGKKTARGLTCYDQQKAIKLIRADDPEWRAMAASSMAVTLERLDRAFTAFFRRSRAGARSRSGYPKFQSANRFSGFGFKKHGNGWRFDRSGRSWRLYVKGIGGLIRARGKFPAMPEKIKTCDLTFYAGSWWLSVVVAMAPRRGHGKGRGSVTFNLIDSFAVVKTANGGHAARLEETVFAAAEGRIVPISQSAKSPSAAGTCESGADRGGQPCASQRRCAAGTCESGADRGHRSQSVYRLRAAGTCESGADRGQFNARMLGVSADGTCESGADRGHRSQSVYRLRADGTCESGANRSRARIAALQAEMARCRRGSYRYRNLRLRKSSIEARTARRRRESLHLWTTALADGFGDLTVFKSRSIAEATASGRGTVADPGAETDLKAALNRRVLDQAPASAISMLEYKFAERGAKLHIIDLDDAPVEVGNAIVTARKTNRKLRKTVNAQRSGKLHRCRQASA